MASSTASHQAMHRCLVETITGRGTELKLAAAVGGMVVQQFTGSGCNGENAAAHQVCVTRAENAAFPLHAPISCLAVKTTACASMPRQQKVQAPGVQSAGSRAAPVGPPLTVLGRCALQRPSC